MVGFVNRNFHPAQMTMFFRLQTYLQETKGIPLTWPMGRPMIYPGSYGEYNGNRDPNVWEHTAGWYGHSQVPENDHGDPSWTDHDWNLIQSYALGFGPGGIVTVAHNDRLDQVGISSGRQVWHRYRLAGADWSEWEMLGNDTFDPMYPPSSAWHTDGYYHVWAQKPGGALWEVTWTNLEGKGWEGFKWHPTGTGVFLSAVGTIAS
jgi:hypothetical protein